MLLLAQVRCTPEMYASSKAALKPNGAENGPDGQVFR